MMNTIELLLPVALVFSWTLGVQLAIWWPRQAVAESTRARAYSAMRFAAAGLLLGYLALVLIILALQGYEDLPRFLLTATAYGNLLQTPLALVALSIAKRERVWAIIGSLIALIFTTGFTWFIFIIMLQLLAYVPLQGALAFLALVLGGGASASVLELYVAVRQPRSRWDESHADLL
ncbi:MAG TPA: hypothetical protein VHB98_13015 [Chloroflexota bacterium]|jgi:hypothetical protein|nr:hypothetical protein [Chloroflexota bacterium]